MAIGPINAMIVINLTLLEMACTFIVSFTSLKRGLHQSKIIYIIIDQRFFLCNIVCTISDNIYVRNVEKNFQRIKDYEFTHTSIPGKKTSLVQTVVSCLFSVAQYAQSTFL